MQKNNHTVANHIGAPKIQMFGPKWINEAINAASSSLGSAGSAGGGSHVGGHQSSGIGGGGDGINSHNNLGNEHIMEPGGEYLQNNIGNESGGAGGSGVTGTGYIMPKRNQLAENRYSKEEFLSFFDEEVLNNCNLPPEMLPKFKKLYVEKIQRPLALTPSTDDEVRIWQTRGPISLGNGGLVGRGGGRGGSVDRGRGRSRGLYHTNLGYQRSTSLYDDDIRGGVSSRIDRGWLERNGGSGIESSDWNNSLSSTSPRKEYISHVRSTYNVENWRRNRPDDEDWRSSNTTSSTNYNNRDKWSRSTSWREDDSSSTTFVQTSGSSSAGGGDLLRSNNSGSTSNSTPNLKDGSGIGGGGDGGDVDNSPVERSSATNVDNNSPKAWINTGQQNNQNTQQQPHDENFSLPEWATENPSDYGGSFDATGAFHDSDDDHKFNSERKKVISGNSLSSIPSTTSSFVNNTVTVSAAGTTVSPSSNEENSRATPINKNNFIENTNQINSNSTPTTTTTTITANLSQIISSAAMPQFNQNVANFQLHNDDDQSKINQNSSPSFTNVDRMQEVADDMVAQLLIMDDEVLPQNSSSNSVDLMNNPQLQKVLPMPGIDIQQQAIQGKALTTPIPNNSNGADNDFWYYRDPQGETQGPFTAAEMLDWYRAGYFLDSLLLRRSHDTKYSKLGELVSVYGGNVPFLHPQQQPPPQQAPPTPQPQQPAITNQSLINTSSNNSNTNPQRIIPELLNVGDNSSISNLMKQQQSPIVVNQVPPPTNIQPLSQPSSEHINYFNMLQKQYLARQQNMIMQKLAIADQWPLLTPEQQVAMINHHMSQVQMPEHLIGGNVTSNVIPVLSDYQMNLSQFMLNNKNMGQPMNFVENKNQSSPPNVLPMMADFQARRLRGNTGDNLFNNTDQMSVENMRPFMNMNYMNVVPHPNQMSTSASTDMNMKQHLNDPHQNDPIKSLILQLSIQNKGGQQQQQPQIQPNSLPPSNDAWLALTANNNQQDIELQQQQLQQQQQQSQVFQGQPSFNNAPINMWDMPSTSSTCTQPIMSSIIPNVSAPNLLGGVDMALMQTLQQKSALLTASSGANVPNNNVIHDSLSVQFLELQQHKYKMLPNEPPTDIKWLSAVNDNIASNNNIQTKEKNKKPRENDDKQTIFNNNNNKKVGQIQLQQQKNKNVEGEKKIQSQITSVTSSTTTTMTPAPTSTVQSKNQKQNEDEKKKDEKRPKPNAGVAGNKVKQSANHDDFITVGGTPSEQQQKSKAKLLESQRRETIKIQEQQRNSSTTTSSASLTSISSNVTTTTVSVASKQSSSTTNVTTMPTSSGQSKSVNKITTTKAPWSNISNLMQQQQGQPSLAEIQKLERERRSEQKRMEQMVIHEQQQYVDFQNTISNPFMSEKDVLRSMNDNNGGNINMSTTLSSIGSSQPLKWNSQKILPQNIKSLAEIQAEEHAKQQQQQQRQLLLQQQEKEINSSNNNLTSAALLSSTLNQSASNMSSLMQQQSSTHSYQQLNSGVSGNTTTQRRGGEKISKKEQNDIQLSSIWNNTAQNLNWSNNKASINNASVNVWGNMNQQQMSGSGFWEEPTKSNTKQNQQSLQQQQNQSKTLSKSHTISNIIQTSNKKQNIQNKAQAKNIKNATTGSSGATPKTKQKDDSNEFDNWCTKALSAISGDVDIPTFVSFLQDIESPFEIKDYIRMYLGETKECTEFGRQFLERRSKYKNQQRAQNAHIDDMCIPAPAITPSTDFQEVKGKGKKVKKNKMTKLDNRILGFSVTAAPDRINVGDRDYGDNA